MSEPNVERRYTQKDFPELSPDLLYQRKQTSLREKLVDVSSLIFNRPNEVDGLQSRSFYGTAKELSDLRRDILLHGLLESLIVCEDEAGYRVLEGNRRAHVLTQILKDDPHACTSFGFTLKRVHARVVASPKMLTSDALDAWVCAHPDATDADIDACRTFIERQVLIVYNREALSRNTERKEWTWVERMRSYAYRMENGETLADIARKADLAPSTVHGQLKRFEQISKFPEILEAVNEDKITSGVARVLCNLDPSEDVAPWIDRVISEKMSHTKLRDLLVNLGLLQNTRNTSGRKSQPPTRGIYFKDASALAVFFADVLSTIDALATTLGIEDAGDQSALADILRDPLRQKIIESYAASTSGDCEDD